MSLVLPCLSDAVLLGRAMGSQLTTAKTQVWEGALCRQDTRWGLCRSQLTQHG